MKVKRSSRHGLLNECLNGLLRDISLKKQAMSGCDSPMPDSPQLHFPSPPGERLQEHCLLEQGHPLPRSLEEYLEKQGSKSSSTNPLTWGWLETLHRLVKNRRAWQNLLQGVL